MKQLIADTHCHTIASTHAYSTVGENVRAAARRGLCAVAITDHGRRMPGAPGTWYFENLKTLPRTLDGVLLLKGIEANVVDFDGSLDTDQTLLAQLEWVIASVHSVAMEGESKGKDCTGLWLQVAQNPLVRVIGHSGSADYPYDVDRVVKEFARQGKLVEINEGTFRVRRSSLPNCGRIVEACKRHGVPVIVNSDAHFHTQVGDFTEALRLLAEKEFPEELVVNADRERFMRYVKEYAGVGSD